MEEYMEDDSTREEFVAYSRLLLRSLKRVREAINEDDKEEALKLIEELIEDTESDIEG